MKKINWDKAIRWQRDILFWKIVVALGIYSINGRQMIIPSQGKIIGWLLVGGAIFVGLFNLYRYIKNKINGNKVAITEKS